MRTAFTGFSNTEPAAARGGSHDLETDHSMIPPLFRLPCPIWVEGVFRRTAPFHGKGRRAVEGAGGLLALLPRLVRFWRPRFARQLLATPALHRFAAPAIIVAWRRRGSHLRLSAGDRKNGPVSKWSLEHGCEQKHSRHGQRSSGFRHRLFLSAARDDAPSARRLVVGRPWPKSRSRRRRPAAVPASIPARGPASRS